MPHAVVEGSVTAIEFYRRFTPFAVRNAGGVCRVRTCWLKNGGDQTLCECVAAGDGWVAAFFILLNTVGRRTTVRLHPLRKNEATAAMRATVAAVTDRFRSLSPELVVVSTNLLPWPKNEPFAEPLQSPAAPRDGADERAAEVAAEATAENLELAHFSPGTQACELSPSADGAPFDWKLIFGRTAPLSVEIGCGGGRRLLEDAVRRSEMNHLAVEYAWEYYRLLRARVVKRGLPNVRLYGADASLLIRRFFPGESVSEYHIYFPDPWPKKKHHKRRLLLPPFCAELHRTLRQDGIVYAASDHAEYFSEFIEYFRALFDVEEIVGPWPDAPNGRTNYEIKYLQAGRPIRRLTARKKQT